MIPEESDTYNKLLRRMTLKADIKRYKSILDSNGIISYFEYKKSYNIIQALIEEKEELDIFVRNYNFEADNTITEEVKKMWTIFKMWELDGN
jgi:hypothetical protein